MKVVFNRIIIMLLFVIITFNLVFSQSENFFTSADSLNNSRKNILYCTYSFGAFTSYVGLYHLWYKEKGMSGFKFFDDNKDWLQMDKFGHVTAPYYIGLCAIKSLKWAGVYDKKAVWQGGLSVLLYMTGIEIMDGFSKEYGFSYGDAIANLFGTTMLISQELLWQEQRFMFKYSFYPSEYAKYRPELLGDNIIQNIIKDYNGQTFWLSMNLKSNLNIDFVPNWLNLAFGYSAFGMTGGTYNPTINAAGENIPDFVRTRQYLISLDVDLTRLNPKSDFLKTLFSVFGFVKIPFTALEYNNKDGFLFHPVYF